MLTFIKLTSAIAPRGPIYVNVAQILSFADQSGGGSSLKMVGGTVFAVTEKAEVVAGRIHDAGGREV